MPIGSGIEAKISVHSMSRGVVRFHDFVETMSQDIAKLRQPTSLVRQLLADMGRSVAESKSGVKKMTEGFEFLGFSIALLRARSVY